MNKNRIIVLISMYCCLALVLDYIKSFIPFLNMPSGGSINIALIPIVICSFHLGTINAMLCGGLWWLVSSLLGLNPYYISLMQYVIDYIIPSIVIGACSLFYKNRKILEAELGILFVMIIRTFCLTLSGAMFWPDGVVAGSTQAWVASCVYNVPYNAATLIMLMLITPLVLNRLKKYML